MSSDIIRAALDARREQQRLLAQRLGLEAPDEDEAESADSDDADG